MKNIAIVGNMYAGKTTLANALVQNHGYTRVSMAGPLKALAKIAYGEIVEKDKEYETIDRETGDIVFKSGRAIYQGIGQSLKDVDRDIWLKVFINDTKDMQAEPYVVDDVRFIFEAEYLRREGWLIVLVDTDEETRVNRATTATGRKPTQAELTHESEREVPFIPWDVYLRGDVGLDKVPEQAEYLTRQ